MGCGVVAGASGKDVGGGRTCGLRESGSRAARAAAQGDCQVFKLFVFVVVFVVEFAFEFEFWVSVFEFFEFFELEIVELGG